MGLKKTAEYHAAKGVVSEGSTYRRMGPWRIHRGVLEKLVGPEKWRAAPYVIWTESGRKVPKGKIATFKPGCTATDPDALRVEDVELVTRAEMMRRNCYRTTCPPEIARVIQLRGALTRKLNNRIKRMEQAA